MKNKSNIALILNLIVNMKNKSNIALNTLDNLGFTAVTSVSLVTSALVGRIAGTFTATLLADG